MEVIEVRDYLFGRWMVGVRLEDGTVRWFHVHGTYERDARRTALAAASE